MNILISGDFYISDAYQNKDLIDKSVIDLFDEADYRMVNLEAPITVNEPKNKILKTGPHLRMSEDTVMPYLKQLKIDAVTLANNHILDYGATGLHDTFESLKQNKIDYLGAGNNLNEATQPLTLEKDGMRIAILNFCENEWSIAEADKPGANPLDIIDNTNQIKAAKATHDKVICIIHGGHEYYHLPSPRMKKQYRFYVDNGADAIVGHHTHCIGGYEIYNDVPIIYSLGNFLFTRPNKPKAWHTGLTVLLKINKKTIDFKLTAHFQDYETFQIALQNAEFQNKVKSQINSINDTINNEKLVLERWEQLILEKSNNYLNTLSPSQLFYNRIIVSGLKKLKLNYLFMHKKQYKAILNQFRCEAHKDLALAATKRFISK